MPELPEVETVRRGLAPVLEGRRILRARTFRQDLRWPFPPRMAERLTGRLVRALRRRSKYILADLDAPAGGEEETWLLHLGMSGRVSIEPHAAAADGGARETLGVFVHDVGAEAAEARTASAGIDGLGPHDHVVLETDAARLIYNDARRFGAMDLWPTADLDRHRLLASLGPEPLGNVFHVDHLALAFRDKAASIKAALLDQKIVAGLGNIYVCEALWRAGISPKRAAGGVSRKRLEVLVSAIRAVLTEAIAAGGSSLRDYRQADGELGYFQHAFAVYGRAGEACPRPRCGGEIKRLAQTGRSSFYCPKCQR